MRNRDNFQAQYKLVKANRVPDVTLGLNYTHNSLSQNNFAPSPENDQLGFNVSLPLPFSALDKDDLHGALLSITQADKQVEAAQVQAETDVRQAAARYKFALETVDQFSHGILNDAEEALEITLYSYRKGSATLLDVRQAESDLNSTYQDYYSALNEEDKALVNLEESAGLWDVRLQ
jgi:cobalt-zinc-cadmium efflux system outer membrane protein